MSKVVLFDCDGVLCDFSSVYLGSLWAVTGRAHTCEEVTHWNFSECVCTPEEDAKVWARLGRMPGTVANLRPYLGMTEVAARVRATARVVAVTAPTYSIAYWTNERLAWLKKFGFSEADVIFTKDKSLVRGDVLVEDNLRYLESWCAANPWSTGILVDRPWNRSSKHLPDNACRVPALPRTIFAAIDSAGVL